MIGEELSEYISRWYSGNITNFAKSQGVSSSQAGRWLKRNCCVIDCVVYCEVSKQVKNNLPSQSNISKDRQDKLKSIPDINELESK